MVAMVALMGSIHGTTGDDSISGRWIESSARDGAVAFAFRYPRPIANVTKGLRRSHQAKKDKTHQHMLLSAWITDGYERYVIVGLSVHACAPCIGCLRTTHI